MARPIDARPLDGAEGWTSLIFDNGREFPVHDPDGSFLREGQSVATMRSSGALGADLRTAQVAAVAGIPGATAPFTPEQGDRMAAAATRVTDAVAPGMPGTPRAAEVDARRAAAAPTPTSAVTPDAPPPPRGSVTPASAPPAPAYVEVPGTKGGMRVTGRQTTGYAPEDKSKIDDAIAALNKGELDYADFLDRVGGIKAERASATLTGQAQRAAVQRDTEREQTAQLERRAQTAKQTYDAALKRDYDPARLWGNPWFALSAAIGGLAGELLVMKGKRDPKQQMQFWQSIRSLVDDDIQRQVDTNSGFIAAAKAELGDSSGALAESVARGRYYEDIANQLDEAVRTAPAEIREEYQLQATKARLESKKNARDAVLAIADKQTTSEANVPGTPARRIYLDEAVLAQNGLKQSEVTEWGASKLTGGEGAVTVNQGQEIRAKLQRDLPTLRELFGGGKNPDKVVWNKLSESAQALLQRAGVKVSSDGTADARAVRQIMAPIVMQYGKELFGVLNEGQAEMAEKAVGSTPEEQLNFVETRLGNVDGLLRRSAAARFGSKANLVIKLADEAYKRIPRAQASGEAY
jgi:hypothetical protein